MMGKECVLNTVTSDGFTFLCYMTQVIRLDPFKSCFLGAVSVTLATSVQSVIRIFEAIIRLTSSEVRATTFRFLVVSVFHSPFDVMFLAILII